MLNAMLQVKVIFKSYPLGYDILWFCKV